MVGKGECHLLLAFEVHLMGGEGGTLWVEMSIDFYRLSGLDVEQDLVCLPLSALKVVDIICSKAALGGNARKKRMKRLLLVHHLLVLLVQPCLVKDAIEFELFMRAFVALQLKVEVVTKERLVLGDTF